MLTDAYTVPTAPADPAISAAAVPTEDRRRFKRHDQTGLVALIADGTHDGPPGGEVSLVDDSAGGVGLRSFIPLPLGARYRLRIDDRPLDQSRTVRIVSCRRRDDEGAEWFIGAAYC